MSSDPFAHIAGLTRIDLATFDPTIQGLLASLSRGPAPARVGQLFPFPVAEQLRILPRPQVSSADVAVASINRWEQIAALVGAELWEPGALRRQLEQLQDDLLAHDMRVMPYIGQLDTSTTAALADLVQQVMPASVGCYFYILGNSELGPELAYLYRGPVAAASRFVLPGRAVPLLERPTMWWAEDGSWCCTTPQDSPSSYLGGPTALVQAVLQDVRIEARRTAADDAVDDWLA